MKIVRCVDNVSSSAQFGVLDFQVEVYVYARAEFLLLCITTLVPRTIEILHVHTLTLPLENLKLQSNQKLMRNCKFSIPRDEGGTRAN